ncbi:hypothetical protein [Streptomyces sp. NPDC001401]|uniref:hypothetical protein n=1 Tax=Streptomyces sp. NPDC001401 TaxID=3364570 RepID=UPI0036CF8F6F
MYRHFPSKEILLEAVLVQQVDDLVDAARWAARTAPVPAFFGFLLEVVETSYGRKHACDARTMSPRSLSGAERYGPLTATGPAALAWCTWHWRVCGIPHRSRKGGVVVTVPGRCTLHAARGATV